MGFNGARIRFPVCRKFVGKDTAPSSSLLEWLDENRTDGAYVDRVEKALKIAVETLHLNANEDYRGNRTPASVRSFEALKKITALGNGKYF